MSGIVTYCAGHSAQKLRTEKRWKWTDLFKETSGTSGTLEDCLFSSSRHHKLWNNIYVSKGAICFTFFFPCFYNQPGCFQIEHSTFQHFQQWWSVTQDVTLWHSQLLSCPLGHQCRTWGQLKMVFETNKNAVFRSAKVPTLSWYNFGWKLSTKRKDDNQGARMIIVNLVYRSFASWKVSGETAH